MDYFLFAIGLVLLVYSGKYLVQSGVSVARHFNIPTLIIGITIIAFGTSAPELIVSVKAALTGNSEIAFGNVVGSNISNIGLVLAITALLIPIPVGKTSWRVDWPVMMIASILLYAFTLNNVLGFWESFILFVFLIAYLFYSVKSSSPDVVSEKNNDNNKAQYKLWISFVIIVAASIGLAYGADLLVSSAVNIATKLGVSKRVISITIVAFGTSLPELTASIIAALKKQTDISIGNIIGSNIFNIMAVLGITGMIHPIEIDHIAFSFDIIWMMFVSVLLFLFIFPFKTVYLTRVEGVLLFLSYILYLTAVIGGYDFESLGNTFHFTLPWH